MISRSDESFIKYTSKDIQFSSDKTFKGVYFSSKGPCNDLSVCLRAPRNLLKNSYFSFLCMLQKTEAEQHKHLVMLCFLLSSCGGLGPWEHTIWSKSLTSLKSGQFAWRLLPWHLMTGLLWFMMDSGSVVGHEDRLTAVVLWVMSWQCDWWGRTVDTRRNSHLRWPSAVTHK